MYYFMIYFIILLTSIASAALIYLIVSREPTKSCFKNFAGIHASGVNQASSALLVLCIAFLLNDVTQIRQKANDTLLMESDILRTMSRLAANLPPDVGGPLQGRLIAYSDAILNEDWPRMQNGTSEDVDAGAGSRDTVIALSEFVIANLDKFGHPQISQQMLSGVGKMRELRLQRIELSKKHPTIEKLSLGIFFCIISVLVLALTHYDRPKQLLAATFLFLWLSMSTLYTVFMMHNPYSGLDPISRAPVAATTGRLKDIARKYQISHPGTVIDIDAPKQRP